MELMSKQEMEEKLVTLEKKLDKVLDFLKKEQDIASPKSDSSVDYYVYKDEILKEMGWGAQHFYNMAPYLEEHYNLLREGRNKMLKSDLNRLKRDRGKVL